MRDINFKNEENSQNWLFSEKCNFSEFFKNTPTFTQLWLINFFSKLKNVSALDYILLQSYPQTSSEYMWHLSHVQKHTCPKVYQLFRCTTPKIIWIWFGNTYPLNQWLVLSWKMLVSPFGQLKNIILDFGSADMVLYRALGKPLMF